MRKIAVLIPTFKPGWYLSRCLDAISNQSISKTEFRLYLALNGPKNGFENWILKSLEDTGLKYKYYYIEEQGVSFARNLLIDESDEEYVVFIDDDDVVSPEYLEELYRVSSKSCMGISKTYGFSDELGDVKDNYIGKAFSNLEDVECSKYKTRKYFSSPWAKMLHRKMIGNVRFDTNLSKGEDSLFMAELSDKVGSLKKADEEACYYVYERPGSASRSETKAKEEVKRISYLLRKYISIFFSSRYDKIFVATRIVATLKHLRGVR